MIQTGFLRPRLTQDTATVNQKCHLPGSHRLWRSFPPASVISIQSDVAVLQPHSSRNRRGLGSSPFARHYLGNHCYFLFLSVLRCFSSRRLPQSYTGVVLGLQPKGLPHSEISGYNEYVPLPRAYRSLSRPSSPLRP